MENFKNELLASLTKYVQIESGSEFDKNTCPSTPGQLELAKVLEKDLKGYTEYKKKVKYKVIPFVWWK